MINVKRLAQRTVVVGAGWLLLSGCSTVGFAPLQRLLPTEPTPEPSEPATFIINGSMTVPGYENYDGYCLADPGYDDIAYGEQITVMDGSGTKLAIGSLSEGVSSTYGSCEFSLWIYDVPEGETLYDIELGNSFRGAVTFSRSELDYPVNLNID